MILTVTLNPSIDKLYCVDHAETGTVMRVKYVNNSAGGKGLNVSRVAAIAGEAVRATGFVGGFSGAYLEKMIRDYGIETDFTSIGAETRSCINVRDLGSHVHTEFLEPGPHISEEELSAFRAQYQEALDGCEVVVLSGSVPAGVPANIYQELIALAAGKEKKTFLDTSGAALKEGLLSKPTLIKPNRDELYQLTGQKAENVTEGAEMAKFLREYYQIPMVILSLGKDGAIMACEDGLYQAKTPDIPVVNTVGCGDSMMAGMAVGLCRGMSVQKSLAYATAVATANAMSVYTGYFESEDLKKVQPLIQVNKLNS